MTRSTTFACVLTGAILACALSLASAEASVTWSFYETAITSCNALPVACVLPPQPFVLARLLLPSDTSSGSTTYTGGGPIAQHVSATSYQSVRAYRLAGLGSLSNSLL